MWIFDWYVVQYQGSQLIDLRERIWEDKTDGVVAEIELVEVGHVLDRFNSLDSILAQVQLLQIYHGIKNFKATEIFN